MNAAWIVVLAWAFVPTVVSAQEALRGEVVVVTDITPVIQQSEHVYHAARASQAPAIDGKADEWQDVPAIVLDRREQTGGFWDGPQDLSGSLRMMWDEQALYLCAQVRDDVHHAVRPTGAEWWENDNVEVAFDGYMNGPSPGYDADELNFVIRDSPDGPIMENHSRRDELEDKGAKVEGQVVAMAVGEDGVRTYEWAMPWSRLEPVSPFILGRCGFDFTLSDNDGKFKEADMAWTPGVHWGRDASKFGQVVFDGAVGAADAVLPLRAEPDVIRTSAGSYWLNAEGTAYASTARLLVRCRGAKAVEATVRVYRPGENKPVATGSVRHQIPANETVALTWDMTALPDGAYELQYDVPQIGGFVSRRVEFALIDGAKLRARRAELVERFGIDRPWDDLADAPAVIRRHRGIVAMALGWLDQPCPLSEEDSVQTMVELSRMLPMLDAGQDYLGARRNEFLSAYYSKVDHSGQGFMTTIPEDYDPAKTYPLLVELHGRGWLPRPVPSAVHRSEPLLRVQPWGRGWGMGYRGLGEDDVLQVIQYMKQWYRIDPDRVYISGGSMGGHGTWWLASQYPDMFAAAAPGCGTAEDCPLQNLRHVPVFNQHGQEDWLVSVDYSRYAISRLQQLAYGFSHQEYAGQGHNFQGPDIAPWLLAQRRPDKPVTVTYTCQSPDHGRAYWLSVREFVDPHVAADVQASVGGVTEGQILRVYADNVAMIEFDTQGMPVNSQAKLLVEMGDQQLEIPSPLPERIYLGFDRRSWRTLQDWSPPQSDTRPYRAGGTELLFTGEPILIVHGSSGGEKRTALLRQAAENLAKFRGRIANSLPVKVDTDLTEQEIAYGNLILLGGAQENTLVARMAQRLPLVINEKKELVAGGRDPVSASDAIVTFVHYNPLAPQRLICLLMVDGDDAAIEKHMADWRWSYEQTVDQPDLVVRSLDGVYRRRMQFTHGWQWQELAGANRLIASAKATGREVVLADLRAMRKATGADFAMNWESDARKDYGDPRYFTLADMATTGAPAATLLCTMTGEELIDAHKRWVAEQKMTVFPAYTPADIDPTRTYRVAMNPDLPGLFTERHQPLSNVQAGPSYRQEDVWAELFDADKSVMPAKPPPPREP